LDKGVSVMSKFHWITPNWRKMLIGVGLLAVTVLVCRVFCFFTTAEAVNIFLVGSLVLVTAVYAAETAKISKSSEKSGNAMQEQAENTKTMLEEMRQLRKRDFIFSLNRAFYQNPQFTKVRAAIHKGDALLEEDGGPFKREDIDNYLNLLEELADHESRGDVDIESIEESFGYFLVKAFHNPHVRNHIERVRREEQDERYYACFMRLAGKVEELSQRGTQPDETQS